MVQITKETFSVSSHFYEEYELDHWPYEHNDYNRYGREDLKERMRVKVDSRIAPSLMSKPVLIRSYFLTWQEKTSQKLAFEKRLNGLSAELFDAY
jgi:hypothetical protein